MSVFPNKHDPRKQMEGVNEVGKGVKSTMGTLMSTWLLWATGAPSNNLLGV